MKNSKLVNNLYYLLPTYISHSNTSAIYDTGASGHYLKSNEPHEIAIQPVAPVQVKQPNGKSLQYNKVCRPKITNLSDEAREAHILPGIAHISLISIGKLCDSRCESSINQHTMAVTKKILLQGERDTMTGLWRVPIQSIDRTTHQSNNIHQVNGKEMTSNIYMRRHLSQ